MSDLLFDVPWWLPALLGLIGLALFWKANNAQKSRPRQVGLALLVIAVAWGLLSGFVDTDKEKAEKGTKQLLSAVVNGDWAIFRSKLQPNAGFRIQGNPTSANGPEEITEFAKAGAEKIHLRSASLQHTETLQTGPLITITANIFSTQELPGAPTMNSNFEFDWEQSTSGWKVKEIRMTKLNGVEMREVGQFLPGGKFR
jgi:hypothetical protein